MHDPNLSSLTFAERTKDMPEDKKDFLNGVRSKVDEARRVINREFQFFDSLSPFREPPIRTYLFSGASPARVGRTGSNAIDMLVSDNFRRGKEKTGLIDSVSRWFSSTGMAQGIKVKALTSRHYEICVVGHDSRDHNLCDVGFGCSQVLPVLIGGLHIANVISDRAMPLFTPIFVVQEPEIHLHPNAQAELGTFFSDLFKASGQLFIETHSPNLVLRLQRHVATGDLKPDEVRIFFVSGGGVPPTVTVMDLNEAGFFSQAWPGGFFPQRQEESLELARAAAAREPKGTKEQEVSN